jgi:hypothetical protein
MCAPPIVSRPSPPPAPAPQPEVSRQTGATDNTARRVGRTFRSGSASQRGRGVLIRSRNPLGISRTQSRNLGTRRSLLTPISISTEPLNVTVGGY